MFAGYIAATSATVQLPSKILGFLLLLCYKLLMQYEIASVQRLLRTTVKPTALFIFIYAFCNGYWYLPPNF